MSVRVGKGLDFAQLPDQGPARPRVSLAGLSERADAVGPEVAVILTELAPCGKQPYLRAEGQRNGPDRSFGSGVGFIAIVDPDLLLRPDGTPNRREIHAIHHERH